MKWKKNTWNLTFGTEKIMNKHSAQCVCRTVFSLFTPDFHGLDWSLQDPPALKNTFHFNVAAAHKVICHLIMTKQTPRLSAVKCMCTSNEKEEVRQTSASLWAWLNFQDGNQVVPATSARSQMKAESVVVVLLTH